MADLLRIALLGAVFILGWLGPPGSMLLRAAPTAEQLSASCERAAELAAQQSGVPVSVLKAISLAESGRKIGGTVRPWPWTVNMEGEGHWFDDYREARRYVEEQYRKGARSFDVGCFQINFKWHSENFRNIDEMFDPLNSALYAARFLSELLAEKGSWKGAAGAYHSRNREFADRYAEKFEQIRTRLAPQDGRPPQVGPIVSTTQGRMSPPDPFKDSGIPEIPDIVAAMGGGASGAGFVAAPEPKRQRINTYPLLIRQAEALPPAGGAPGASLFTGASGEGNGLRAARFGAVMMQAANDPGAIRGE